MTKDQVQTDALSATYNKQKCSVVLGTGVGKTLLGLTHIENNSNELMKVLVVAPKKAIFQSWIDDAMKFNKSNLLNRITFTTYLSLNKHDPKEYHVVYLDEMHSLLDSHRGFLQLYKGKILGLSGTPPKRDYSEKGKLVNEFCPVVFTFKADDAVENGILNDYQIIVHQLKLSNEKNIFIKGSGYYTDEESNYNYWSKKIDVGYGNIQMTRVMRMKAMMDYKSKENYTKKLTESINTKCIIFANTQLQAERLCNYSYHSNNSNSEENLEKFKSGEITKLSTVLQLSEGVNIPELKQGIIMHAYGNERKASQRIGRLLRLNPNDKSIVHILCYMDTIDQKWVTDALEGFDQSKILWKDFQINNY